MTTHQYGAHGGTKSLGWGYACCYQTTRNSMCLGEKGRKNALLKEYNIKKAREDEFKKFAQQVPITDQPESEEKPSPEKAFQVPAAKNGAPVVKEPEAGKSRWRGKTRCC